MERRANRTNETVRPVHVLFFLATLCGAAIAVPLFYQYRMSEVLFGLGLAGFMGLPLVLAILWPHVTQSSWVLILSLLAACPLVYFAAEDLLPSWGEIPRDAFFLMTGANLIFVSTSWTSHFVSVRQWTRAMLAGLGAFIGLGAVFVMVWMYLYFE